MPRNYGFLPNGSAPYRRAHQVEIFSFLLGKRALYCTGVRFFSLAIDSSSSMHPNYLLQAAANGKGDSITVPPGTPLPRLSQQQQQPQQQHLCPITRCPMEDPTVAADGFTYER